MTISRDTMNADSIPADEKGFSLVELLVVITLFSVVAVVVVGSLLSLIDANAKARTQQMVLSNLSVPMEIMVQEMQLLKDGTNYDIPQSDRISFIQSDDTAVGFRLNGSRIERQKNGTWSELTALDVEITALEFELVDYNGSADNYPVVSITIRAKSGRRIKTQSEFKLQTTVSPQYLAPIN